MARHHLLSVSYERQNLSEVFGGTAYWNKNSVGDLMDILLQALEVRSP